MRANDPDALYRLLQKERGAPFPFTVSEDGEIFVTGPLDREEKNMVTNNNLKILSICNTCDKIRLNDVMYCICHLCKRAGY